jgi:hypothetical protein
MIAPRITVSRCKGKKFVAQQAIPATGTEMVINQTNRRKGKDLVE